MKFTAIAPSNIAFIKYWGKKDADLRLPTNGSISMNLSNLSTKTTVGFSLSYKEDKIDGDEPFSLKEKNRIIAHLDRIRKLAGVSTKAKIVTKNNFPIGTGLSSSASGFAALTLAASKALGLDLTEKELSIIARLGSGSACRSIPDGFVEWLKGNSSESSYARSIYAPGYWNLVDTVAIVNQGRKKISSSEGQRFVGTSPFYPKRLSHMENKIKTLKKYLKDKNFQSFGELIQLEALELHAIMLTSQPA